MRRLACVAVLTAACGPAGVAQLDGPGGDVWGFEQRITGRTVGCDDVRVESPRGSVVAAIEEGSFAAVVPLGSGDNEVRAICRAEGNAWPSAPLSWVGRLPDRPQALARARYSDTGLVLDGSGSQRSPVRPAAVTRFTWEARANNPAPLVGLPARGERVDVVVPEIDGDYFVDLQVEDSDGVEDHASVRFRVDHGELLIVDAAREHPAWVDDAVVYGVAPFFFGGRLTDVIGRLDELAELGVTVLWLSPVTVASEGDFGYAVTDHFAVREDFGGDQALRELVDAAHQHGMRVIMDFVANHTAIEHPYVQARPDFYERDTNGELQHYFDWENLPNLDLDHPEVRAWLSAAFAYWVGEFGIDGFRADAAWGPAERSPDFWAAIRAELVRIEPDLLLLAEATARDSFYVDRGFDVAYDWTWEPGQWAWQEAFEQADAASLGAALTSDGEGFDPDAVIFRFLDNNDTGARFVTRHGVDRVPAAAAVLFTVPGIPSLWSGSEVGAELEPYDEGPPLTWDDPHGLSAVYRKLATLRRTLPALRGRSIDLVPVTGPDDVIAYLRPGESAVLVVVDLRGEPGEIALPWTPALEAMARGNSLRDAYHGENLPLTVDADVLRLTLPEDGVRVLVAKP